jgi:hypothetical protein
VKSSLAMPLVYNCIIIIEMKHESENTGLYLGS